MRVCIAMATATGSKGARLPRYVELLVDLPSKERYWEKLKFIGGKDPYEIPKETWKDNVDLWPSVTYINMGMYLVFSPNL